MKKFVSIVVMAVALALLSASAVWASASDGFKLVSCNPEDGYDNVKSNNVMIKMFFSEAVSAEETRQANENMFKFTDGDGEKIPFKIYYNDKDATNICLLATEDLTDETEYTVLISGELQSDGGSVLGADKMIEFKTKKPDSMVAYMFLMLAMIVVMVFMTFRDQKKAASAGEAQDTGTAIRTNPYKLAKEKKISVEEAVKMIEAEKAKAAKKSARSVKSQESADIGSKSQGKNNSVDNRNRDVNGKKAEPDKESLKAGEPARDVYKVKTKRIVKRH